MPECEMCKQHVLETHDIRGIKACMHCQLNRIWDYIEGTRRMVDPSKVYKGEREYVHIPEEFRLESRLKK